jgi:ribosomal protein L3 glutamine methyltransferase
MKDREDIVNQLHTVRDYVRWGTSLMTEHGVFFGHGSDNAWDESLFLVQAALHWPQPFTEQVLDSRLLLVERNKIIDWLLRRTQQRLPLPYITGRAWFAGLQFNVDRRVIIPRSPIAELIEQDFAPWYAGAGIESVLDLCAGSGCIGIACAMYMPDARVDLVDISTAALELATENIRLHAVADRVVPIQSDLFAALAPEKKRYDLIVSNPPYVDAADLASMPAEFRHEPGIALAAGEDGLELAHRILREAPDYLADDGLLVLEVGNSAVALERCYPDIAFTWVDFERGGEGVLVISAAELAANRASFTV